LQDVWLLTVLSSDGLTARWTRIAYSLNFNVDLVGSPFVSFASALSMNPYTLVTMGGTNYPRNVLQDLNYFPQVNATVFLWVVNVSNASATVNIKPISPYGQSPSAPVGTTALASNGSIILFGGIDPCTAMSTDVVWTQPVSDSSCLQISNAPWVPLQLNIPATDTTFSGLSMLENASLAFLFGGRGVVYASTFAPQLWTYNANNGFWRQMWYDQSSYPVHRFAHVQATLLNSVYIFGGGHHRPSGQLEFLNDMWMWQVLDDEGNGYWVSLLNNGTSTAPSPRFSAAWATFQSRLLYVHGGDDNVTIFSDLWVFNAVDRSWSRFATNTALTGHNALFLGGVLYLFFGRSNTTGSSIGSTIHRFHEETGNFSILPVTQRGQPWPPARQYAAAATLSAEVGTAVFYGGLTPEGNVGDMWVFYAQSSSWMSLTLTAPIKQRAMGVLYLASRAQLISVGGSLQQADTMSFITLGCNPGHYSQSLATNICQPCEQGFYSEDAGASLCTAQCPINLFTPTTGSISVQNCTVCQPGVCNGHGTCRVLATNLQDDLSGKFECTCSGWYRYSESDNCSTPVVAVIVLTILLSVGAAACIFIYCRRSHRHRKELFENYELKAKLLDDAEEGLREYERVWDINFDDLKLGELIAEGSFGAVRSMVCVCVCVIERERHCVILMSVLGLLVELSEHVCVLVGLTPVVCFRCSILSGAPRQVQRQRSCREDGRLPSSICC
jgi:hypothetical protein